jgi:transcription antitermination protein NusB
MKDRSRARGWALQVLYAWESRGMKETPFQTFRQLERERHMSENSVPYAQRLIETFERNRTQVERAVEENLSNWRLERLSVIDRNILRLATAEMLFIDDVPPRVTIQEAIVLAEKYGTNESPRFVNGVLDALMKGRAAGGAEEHA